MEVWRIEGAFLEFWVEVKVKFSQATVRALRKSHEWTNSEIDRVTLVLLEEHPQAKVLDLGCETGELTKEVGLKIGTDDVSAVEIVEEHIKSAERKGIKVHRADLNGKLPFEDETFDVIYSNQTIEHLYDTDNFVNEIWRVLKKGGYAVVATPNLASLHSIFALILGWQPNTAFVSDKFRVGNPIILNPEVPPAGCTYPAHSHLRIFTWSALRGLFSAYGFKVERMTGAGYYPFVGKIAKFIASVDGRHSAALAIKARKL